jgi:predicted GH43/DUF377 family glycosyl hydrolase
MRQFLRLVLLTSAFAIAASGLQAQFVWQKSSANPVLPEWAGDNNDPSNYKYAFEPTVLYDSAAQVYRAWFASLAWGPAKFVVSSAISFEGRDWYASMKNPVFSGSDAGFDAMVRCPRVLRDGTGYRMYYTGITPTSYTLGLALSSDGKTWTRYANSPILMPDSVSKWDLPFQAFCDVYKSDSEYYMWFTGGDGVHNTIGLAKSPDGIHWTEVPGNPIFIRASSGWDSVTVGSPAVVRVGNTFYMFYNGSAIPGAVNFSIGLATSSDGIHWVRQGTAPVLTLGADWDGASLGILSVLYRNGTFHMWYSALSNISGHWQTGYATSPYVPLGVAGGETAPEAFSLLQNFPNPFNPSTKIRYTLPHRSHLTLEIFNTLGQKVTTILDRDMEAGSHEVEFDGKGLASGVYFYRMKAGDLEQTKKFTVLK